MRRSWKVSLLAVVVISMSVFIGGAFLLLTENLTRVVAGWREDAKIVVYLRGDADPEAVSRLRKRLTEATWVGGIEEVSTEQAEARFQRIFPSLAELLEGLEEEPLPPSLELEFDSEGIEPDVFESWRTELAEDPSVVMVDDDRDWLKQVELLVALLGGLGVAVGITLLVAAVFTIASVIRLTAYLYREEIAVMRMVGATELYIRGPFYVEGLMQGMVGGLVAVSLLFLAYLLFTPGDATSVLGFVVADRFLSPSSVVTLLGLGAAAGLLGAVISVRRESLDSSG